MMRYIVSILLALCLFQNMQGQEGAKLTVPSSPAFSILNFEPTAVMRPANARDLASDILNSFDNQGKLLVNLGLEVAPYWLGSHPKLQRSTYLNPSVGQAFLQSFSLSAATVKDSASGNNKLGAGFRFKLFNGKPVDELTIASNQLKRQTTIVDNINGLRRSVGSDIKTKQDAINTLISNLQSSNVETTVINNLKKQADALQKNFSDSPADIVRFLDSLIDQRMAADSALIKKVSALVYERKGFVLEFAGANSFNTTNRNNLERIGLWGNASYFVSPDDLITLTARFMNQNTDTSLRNFDVGLGFLKKTSKFNVSLESMARWYRAEIPFRNASGVQTTRLDNSFTYRFAVQSAYNIMEGISINLNFGKDFSSPFISGSGFFSIFGVNYSIFSRKPAELLQEKE